MKKLIFILFLFSILYSCSKTESTPSVTPPVVIKLSGCDSIKQGLLKTTSDTVRLVSCVSITGCDSVRLGLLKSTKDLLRLGCNSVTIGTQKWMIVNLDIETYRNGDIIPQVTDPTIWAALKTGAWCYFNNDAANGAKYGKLYNWYAVNDSRGLAPQGWHIPSDPEWATLSTFLGGDGVSGGKLKEVGYLNWQSNTSSNGTNESGFAALPGGYRDNYGEFKGLGLSGIWWSTTQAFQNNTGNLPLAVTSQVLYRDGKLVRVNYTRELGCSVRCLRD
jgi:uncharacterized protein (TIGR02145 family)